MCTIVLLRRPDHDWPLILAANRDELQNRPWLLPSRHWPDRAEVTAGQDALSKGTWLGINDWGLISGVLNRSGTLGPVPEKRSRGELPLEVSDLESEIEKLNEHLSTQVGSGDELQNSISFLR